MDYRRQFGKPKYLPLAGSLVRDAPHESLMVVACDLCSAIICDTRPDRDAHDQLHQALNVLSHPSLIGGM